MNDMRTAELHDEWTRARNSVPYGMEHRHNRVTYGKDPVGPKYGVCAHGLVCLSVSSGWLHPKPEPGAQGPYFCHQPPTETVTL
jgi:hypothetical protein